MAFINQVNDGAHRAYHIGALQLAGPVDFATIGQVDTCNDRLRNQLRREFATDIAASERRQTAAIAAALPAAVAPPAPVVAPAEPHPDFRALHDGTVGFARRICVERLAESCTLQRREVRKLAENVEGVDRCTRELIGINQNVIPQLNENGTQLHKALNAILAIQKRLDVTEERNRQQHESQLYTLRMARELEARLDVEAAKVSALESDKQELLTRVEVLEKQASEQQQKSKEMAETCRLLEKMLAACHGTFATWEDLRDMAFAVMEQIDLAGYRTDERFAEVSNKAMSLARAVTVRLDAMSDKFDNLAISSCDMGYVESRLIEVQQSLRAEVLALDVVRGAETHSVVGTVIAAQSGHLEKAIVNTADLVQLYKNQSGQQELLDTIREDLADSISSSVDNALQIISISTKVEDLDIRGVWTDQHAAVQSLAIEGLVETQAQAAKLTGDLLSAIGKSDREIRRTRTRVGDGESRLDNLATICPDPSVIADLHSEIKSLTHVSDIVVDRVAAHHDALAERATDVDFLSNQLEVLAIDAASEVSLGEVRGNVNLLTKHAKDISRRLGVGLGKIKQISHLAKTSQITFSAGITSLWDYCRALRTVNMEQWRQIDETVNSMCHTQRRVLTLENTVAAGGQAGNDADAPNQVADEEPVPNLDEGEGDEEQPQQQQQQHQNVEDVGQEEAHQNDGHQPADGAEGQGQMVDYQPAEFDFEADQGGLGGNDVDMAQAGGSPKASRAPSQGEEEARTLLQLGQEGRKRALSSTGPVEPEGDQPKRTKVEEDDDDDEEEEEDQEDQTIPLPAQRESSPLSSPPSSPRPAASAAQPLRNSSPTHSDDSEADEQPAPTMQDVANGFEAWTTAMGGDASDFWNIRAVWPGPDNTESPIQKLTGWLVILRELMGANKKLFMDAAGKGFIIQHGDLIKALAVAAHEEQNMKSLSQVEETAFPMLASFIDALCQLNQGITRQWRFNTDAMRGTARVLRYKKR